MKWTAEAEVAIKKVPFFVRKKVRLRVENEAAAAGKKVVSLADVKVAQARFMTKMSSEIKGYQVDTCFGSSGCPNPANSGDSLLKKIEEFLEKEDLLGFLKQGVKGDLKFHHEFKVTLAECPNACSQPQIKDIGIIGACIPLRRSRLKQNLFAVPTNPNNFTKGALAMTMKDKENHEALKHKEEKETKELPSAAPPILEEITIEELSL